MIRASEATYEKCKPPEEVLFLTAGIDTQDDRLSLSVFGFGRNEEMFLINRQVLYGSPARADVWKQLDGFCLASLKM